MTSTLVGAALHDSSIGSLDDRCDLYLPRLRGSSYEGVTVRDAMRMCSGVAWSWAGPASARACARSAASANWCWRTAKRSAADASCRPAGANSPASPTARPPPSVGRSRQPRGVRLSMVGAAARADRRPRRRLFGDRHLRPVHPRPSGRAGGHRRPERRASASGQRRRSRDLRAARSCGARAPTGPGAVGPGATPVRMALRAQSGGRRRPSPMSAPRPPPSAKAGRALSAFRKSGAPNG
jgi:hypothetical protein